MGEIADMMLDGTMDPETGEFNFDGADGPGWPMTSAEAAAYKRENRAWSRKARREMREAVGPGEPAFAVSKRLRRKVEAFGELRQNDAYHWQVRKDGKVVADWWPHKRKYRIGDRTLRGDEGAFLIALGRAAA